MGISLRGSSRTCSNSQSYFSASTNSCAYVTGPSASWLCKPCPTNCPELLNILAPEKQIYSLFPNTPRSLLNDSEPLSMTIPWPGMLCHLSSHLLLQELWRSPGCKETFTRTLALILTLRGALVAR